MSSVLTTKRIAPGQLSAELGGVAVSVTGDADSVAEKLVEVAGVALAALEAAINAHAAPRYITKKEFIDRFTTAEQVALTTSAHPAAVKTRNMLYTHPKDVVNLDAPDVVDGLAGLVGALLLTPDRPAQLRA